MKRILPWLIVELPWLWLGWFAFVTLLLIPASSASSNLFLWILVLSFVSMLALTFFLGFLNRSHAFVSLPFSAAYEQGHQQQPTTTSTITLDDHFHTQTSSAWDDTLPQASYPEPPFPSGR